MRNFYHTHATRSAHARSSHEIGSDARDLGVLVSCNIGFEDDLLLLARLGFSFRDLLASLEASLRLGVSPIRAFVSLGADHERRLYQSFARALGFRFVTHAPPLCVGDVERDLARGVSEVMGAGSRTARIYAPEPENLAVFLKFDLDAPMCRTCAFLTTPTLFRSFLVAKSVGVQGRAAWALSRRFPEQSAAGLSVWKRRIFAALACASGLAFCFPNAAAIDAALFLPPVLFKLFAVCMSERPRAARRRLLDRDLPVYTILAPLYREGAVVRQLLEALTAIDYPGAKLDVKLLLEDDDVETMSALTGADMPPWFEVLVLPAGEPRTKPRALNAGLLAARGDLLVVYDAEDIPDRDQLREAAAKFAEGAANLACLQAALAIDNIRDSLVAKCFAAEYASLFDILLPGYVAMGAPIPLGGTSNHFKVAALRRVGGWDAWNVTEDVDLGLRLVRAGYCCDVMASTTYGEAPVSYSDWDKQRRRWLKGWMTTLLVLSNRSRFFFKDFGLWTGSCVLALVGGSLAGLLATPFGALAVALATVRGDIVVSQTVLDLLGNSSALFLAITGLVSIFAPLLLGSQRRRIGPALLLLSCFPFYLAAMSWACWVALYELCVSPHSWAKTQHGLARSRSHRA